MSSYFSDNRKLIEALKSGNTLAFTYLFDTYYRPLCAYAHSLIQDEDEAADIVQNVFLRTWQKRKKLKPDFSVKNFLYRSVYNEFIDQYRKQKAVTALEKKYIDALEAVVEEEDGNLGPILEKLQAAIDTLPPKCKETFILSKKDGLTNMEIADYLGISVKTVENHITKAFTKLRSEIGDNVAGLLFLLFGKQGFEKISNS